MAIDIDKLSEKELIDLNHRIIERLKFLDQVRRHSEMLEFSIGDQVSFHPSGRGKLIGTIFKYNKKTVAVITEQGERWNVSPNLLTKIKNTGSEVKSSNNIIEIKKSRDA